MNLRESKGKHQGVERWNMGRVGGEKGGNDIIVF